MKVRPVLDRIMIKQDAAQDKMGKFLLAETAQQKPLRGTVVAVGPGALNSMGKTIPMEVKVGDSVVYGQFVGQPVEEEGEEYIIMKEGDLFYILDL
jgi:chaperonin GroES